ncbi:hypothetical protein CTEN210_00749 [Chaetoceros tenuissimus]|uniref:Uncharacterized protein n=1 Tax=Chaetoceros tenuissimus TaxID=426638 RepID=A0AAD3CFS0_9STRA|nr:hypothetical protein CTEN210_00749 [Chaetoceros tenuissimus]
MKKIRRSQSNNANKLWVPILAWVILTGFSTFYFHRNVISAHIDNDITITITKDEVSTILEIEQEDNVENIKSEKQVDLNLNDEIAGNASTVDFSGKQIQDEQNSTSRKEDGSTNQNALNETVFSRNETKQEQNSTAILDEYGSTYLTMYGDHRVPSSLAALPPWLQEYIAWNQNERATKDPKDLKFFVIKCGKKDSHCGGFSDRLRPVPFYLLMSKMINRVFCIYWERPMRLESFLQVPKGGLDWTCPSDFNGEFGHASTLYWGEVNTPEAKESMTNRIEYIKELSDQFVTVKTKNNDFQHINYLNAIFAGYSYENQMPKVFRWMHVYLMEHIFRVMFKPIPAIARNVNATMKELGLVEGKYTSVHFRARYPTAMLKKILGGQNQFIDHDKGKLQTPFEGQYKSYLLRVAKNAIGCGANIDPDMDKIFFSSDDVNLVDYVISNKIQTTHGNVQCVGVGERSHVKHMEYHKTNSDEDFYPLIEDLLVMGGSKCVAHGVGSFGAFGASLAGNRCRAMHRRHSGKPLECPNYEGATHYHNITDEHRLFGPDPFK